MSIRLPGVPAGVDAQRICAGTLVEEDEFELRGGMLYKGGHFGTSAVVVTPKEGWTFEPSPSGPANAFIAKQAGA